MNHFAARGGTAALAFLRSIPIPLLPRSLFRRI